MERPGKGHRILRPAAVLEMLGISRVTLWRWEREGHFPPKRQLGPNTVGWLESDVLQWLEARPATVVGGAR